MQPRSPCRLATCSLGGVGAHLLQELTKPRGDGTCLRSHSPGSLLRMPALARLSRASSTSRSTSQPGDRGPGGRTGLPQAPGPIQQREFSRIRERKRSLWAVAVGTLWISILWKSIFSALFLLFFLLSVAKGRGGRGIHLMRAEKSPGEREPVGHAAALGRSWVMPSLPFMHISPVAKGQPWGQCRGGWGSRVGLGTVGSQQRSCGFPRARPRASRECGVIAPAQSPSHPLSPP